MRDLSPQELIKLKKQYDTNLDELEGVAMKEMPNE